jgi:hypothetical protein
VTPTATLLRYLADVAAAPPSDRHPLLPPGAGPEMLDVTRSGQAPAWLGTGLSMPLEAPYPEAEVREHRLRSTPALRGMAALAALQPAERILRLGWVVVAGTLTVEGREVTCCLPLISQPVAVLGAASSRCRISATGPTELTPLVEDPDDAARLEAAAQYGGGAFEHPHLQAWIRNVAAAIGLPPLRTVLPPAEDPLDHRRDDGLVACVGALVYVDRDLFRPNLETALRRWAATPGVESTAFGALYAGVAQAAAPTGETVVSPLRLTDAQREAVVRARHEPLAVISGPPGSGKSHTVAAVAADAVAAGRSVLVATRSGHAADVVSGLLGRQPGPDPLRFGDGADDDLVRQATSRGTSGGDAARARAELERAYAHQRLAAGAIARLLGDERRAEGAGRWDGLVAHLASLAPGAFDPEADLGALTGLAAEAERRRARAAERDTWWRRRQARRADHRLTAALGAGAPLPPGEVATVLECAVDRRTAARLATSGGTVAGPTWDQLEAADAAVRAAAGRLAEVLGASEDRRRRARDVAGDLGVALRVGRRQRRRLLRDLDGRRLVAGLPLWVGTLRDIDDLLPETPGLFDVVILDEASQIDQPSGAGALLRARRAVIVGDPRQLRHVSFVADATMVAARAEHGLGSAAARLDVRRASVLDAAAGVTTTTWLDEHFRSVPHLIDFSARRFYGGRLHVATRRPANEVADAIAVVRPDDAGEGDGDAADAADLATALRLVAGLAESGRRDIAVVSPFRDVADAAQDALLTAYDVDAIGRLGLRVGTVHAFQGAEADHVVLILGVRDGDAAGRRRFVEDPHLFNVMVTRARRSLVVVTTLASPAGAPRGLIEEYLVHADRPPGPPADGPCPTPWVETLARELRALGATVRTGYPVGRFAVDVVLGAGEGAVAVDAAVDRAGIDAHVARRRLLAGQGWRTLDGYPTRWDGDPTRGAIELAGALTPTDAPAGSR